MPDQLGLQAQRKQEVPSQAPEHFAARPTPNIVNLVSIQL